ncbi:MAG: sensor histidine kinase [Caldimonas sp.]
MRRRSFTITQRVIWAVTATVALLVGLQTVLAYVSMHAQEDELTDDLLHHEVQHLIELARAPGLMPAGAVVGSPRVRAWLSRDGVGASDVPPQVRELGPGLYQLEPEGQVWHVAVVDTEDGRLSVILDATATEARMNRFGLTLLALWFVCVGATVFIARGVAAIAVGPIVSATRSIARWAPDRAPGASAARDEASTLMEAFNRFRDHVDETVAREREFAANLDHEIRTPLTAIRTDAELIGIEAQLAPAARQRLERILASVDEISATTESTLASSAGGTVEAEPVNLREAVRIACDAMADRAAARQLRIAVEVAEGEVIVADRQALLTVCRNIVRNALEHAAPALLTIEGDRRGLRFRDDGPGIPAAALPHVFERYHQGHRSDAGTLPGTPRRGLGLAIARRMCDLQGWRLGVSSPADGGSRGTTFTLAFAPDAADAESHQRFLHASPTDRPRRIA